MGVLRLVFLSIQIFCDVTLCWSVNFPQRFGGTYSPHLQTLSDNKNNTYCRYIPEGRSLPMHRCSKPRHSDTFIVLRSWFYCSLEIESEHSVLLGHYIEFFQVFNEMIIFQITNLMHNSFIFQQYVCYTTLLNMFRAACCSEHVEERSVTYILLENKKKVVH